MVSCDVFFLSRTRFLYTMGTLMVAFSSSGEACVFYSLHSCAFYEHKQEQHGVAAMYN